MGFIEDVTKAILTESTRRVDAGEENASVQEVLKDQVSAMGTTDVHIWLNHLNGGELARIIRSGEFDIDAFLPEGSYINTATTVQALNRALLYEAMAARLVESDVPIGNQDELAV